MHVELIDAEATILEEIADKAFTVAGITMTYAMAIKADANQHISQHQAEHGCGDSE